MARLLRLLRREQGSIEAGRGWGWAARGGHAAGGLLRPGTTSAATTEEDEEGFEPKKSTTSIQIKVRARSKILGVGAS
jgi:hypothetical protein